MKIVWISIGWLFCCLPTVYSQTAGVDAHTNLVYNGSFEEYRMCPRKLETKGVLTIVDGWYQPTAGSADYYNECGSRECGVPKNKLGYQMPQEGKGFCGIYCSKTEYREYLQTRLRRRLRPGDSIRTTFYVSLSEESTGAIATIGALFTENRITDTIRSLFLTKETHHLTSQISQTIAKTYAPQVVNPANRPLDSVDGWQKISGTFVAEGGEQYVTLGNFFPIERSGYSEPDTLTQLLPGAYYYIDNVTIECLNCTPPETDDQNADSNFLSQEQSSFDVGGTFVLKDIFFEFDKSTLLQQSHFELMKLIALLRVYPKMEIEIQGHTDDKGSESYNLKLSEARAKAVADYVISKGIDEKRIRYKGFGKSAPLVGNDTEEGRATNRRVAFKVTAF